MGLRAPKNRRGLAQPIFLEHGRFTVLVKQREHMVVGACLPTLRSP